MASINKVTLIGNLGRDPEVRSLPSGDQIANLTIATTDKWKDKHTGEPREATEWHRVTFTGRLAEIAAQYLRKGAQVYVEGSLRTRKWTDQEGVEKYSTEVRADTLQMLGGGVRREQGAEPGPGQQQGQGPQGHGRDGSRGQGGGQAHGGGGGGVSGGYLRGHQQAQANAEQAAVREEFEDVPF